MMGSARNLSAALRLCEQNNLRAEGIPSGKSARNIWVGTEFCTEISMFCELFEDTERS